MVLTDSQEISLICERTGVGFHWNKDLRFTSLDIVAEMRDLLGDLARRYEHCIILRASCPLLTWVDVEDAWKKYLEAGADSLVTVKSVRPLVFVCCRWEMEKNGQGRFGFRRPGLSRTSAQADGGLLGTCRVRMGSGDTEYYERSEWLLIPWFYVTVLLDLERP